MTTNCELPGDVVQFIRKNPIHTVLFDFGHAAVQYNMHCTNEFKKLVAYVMELADGRDRREPWVNRANVARPVPKLRVAIDDCFAQYGDLQWFKLNKTTNQSGLPLTGLFPRMAASLARVDAGDFGRIVQALVSSNPDTALLRLFQENSGTVKAVGVELFSRLAFAFRRDLYFVIPREWGESSGALKFIDRDLRRYCAMCRTIRSVCDQLGLNSEIRGSIFMELLDKDPPPQELQIALGKAIGPTLARFAVLEPTDAFDATASGDDQIASPVEFAAKTIRARRGDRKLRNELLKAYGDKCAVSGKCPRDLLEVAYIVPFPSGHLHSVQNALLLRSDLHTLWDLNMIGVEPETMKIHIAPQLKETTYEQLAGRTLVSRRDGLTASQRALAERWEVFQNGRKHREKIAAGKGVKSSNSKTSQQKRNDAATIEIESKTGAVAARS